MSSEATLTRISSFVMFLSCSLSAFCMAMMGYTYATGELPFNIQPILEVPDIPAEKKEKDKLKESHEKARRGETFAVHLYEEMLKERRDLVEERGKMNEEKKILLALKASADEIHKKLEETELNIRKLLVEIDENEMKNVKKLSDVLVNTESDAAAKMLLEMDENLAARTIFVMQAKKAAEVISAVMTTGGQGSTKKAATILERIHKLSAELQK